jgi:ankyrin repeat protein
LQLCSRICRARASAYLHPAIFPTYPVQASSPDAIFNSNGAENGKIALHAAIDNHQVPVVEALLAAKADPNIKSR